MAHAFIEALQLVVVVFVFSHPLITLIIGIVLVSWAYGELALKYEDWVERRAAAKAKEVRHEHKDHMGD